jgi:hypothetical protein
VLRRTVVFRESFADRPIHLDSSDIHQVAGHSKASQSIPLPEQAWKHVVPEITRALNGNSPNDRWLDDVDSRVDQITELAPAWRLLDESPDPASRIQFDDTLIPGIVNLVNGDRHVCLTRPVMRHHCAQIWGAKEVAIDNQERLVEEPRQWPNRARRSKKCGLVRVDDAYAKALAVAKVANDCLWQVMKVDRDVSAAMVAQEMDEVLENRSLPDWQHRLRTRLGQRQQARPLACREKEGFHILRNRVLGSASDALSGVSCPNILGWTPNMILNDVDLACDGKFYRRHGRLDRLLWATQSGQP